MKYSKEEKLRIVLEVLEGRALKSICRELGLNRHSVRSWISRYHLYGEDGLCVASSTKRSTAIEKEKIVLEYLNEDVTLAELSLRYDYHRDTIHSWVRKYRQNGASTFVKPVRKKSMARPKKKAPETELERLQEEVLWLRAENALLKKVRALVEEERNRARHAGQKPSKN